MDSDIIYGKPLEPRVTVVVPKPRKPHYRPTDPPGVETVWKELQRT